MTPIVAASTPVNLSSTSWRPTAWRAAWVAKGNCWENVPTKSWFNSFKNERVHGLRSATRAEMTAASFDYIEVFYNRTRRHSALDYSHRCSLLDDWRMAQHDKSLVA